MLLYYIQYTIKIYLLVLLLIVYENNKDIESICMFFNL